MAISFLQSYDDDSIKVNSKIENAFRNMYPAVTGVELEKEGIYYVADFG